MGDDNNVAAGESNAPRPLRRDVSRRSEQRSIIERMAPGRRVDFLRWRERVKRHGENDELLAVGWLSGYVRRVDGSFVQRGPARGDQTSAGGSGKSV
jgi:hypothetical protein